VAQGEGSDQGVNRRGEATVTPGVREAAAQAMIVAESKTPPRAASRLRQPGEAADVWRVVVVNDPVNLMSYVVMVFPEVLSFDEMTARKHMLEVHELGRSIVWTGVREQAEPRLLPCNNGT